MIQKGLLMRHPFRQNNDKDFDPRRISNQSLPVQQQFQKFGPIFVAIVSIVLLIAAFGVYHLSKFFINSLASVENMPEFINTNSVPTWVVTIILVVLVLGLLRSATTYLANIVKFVFKIAQSDIVTIILAVVINAVLLFLNGWITLHVVQWIAASPTPSFFTSGSIWSIIVMFCTLASSLVWIPRIGTYGENRLGQFDD